MDHSVQSNEFRQSLESPDVQHVGSALGRSSHQVVSLQVLLCGHAHVCQRLVTFIRGECREGGIGQSCMVDKIQQPHQLDKDNTLTKAQGTAYMPHQLSIASNCRLKLHVYSY